MKKIITSIFPFAILSLVPFSANANIASTVESIGALSSGAGYQINDVIMTSELQRRVNTDSAVQQAYYALLGEIDDGDGDNVHEAPAMRASLSGFTPPTSGGFIPSSSLAPKVDGYGMPLGYCAWDHGTTNTSTDRITGVSAVTNNHVNFALLSSGSDRSFDTTCSDAASGNLVGDDHYRLVTVGEGHYGVATNQHFGKPVATLTDLLALDTSLTEPGELRVVLEEGKAYAWLDLNSDGTYQWDAISGGGSDYFHAGDSNGATAGGEYSSTPYDLGVGARFTDTNLVPRATVEVDGRLAVVDGDGLIDTTGGAQLHVGNQVASPGTSGEVTRLAIQPYGHTGGPFNFVARDVGSEAFLDLRYGDRLPSESMISISHEGRIGLGTETPLAKLHIHTPDINGPDYVDLRFSRGSTFTPRHIDIASDDSFRIARSGIADDLVITKDGDIGVGTANPLSRFHLSSSDSGTLGDAMLTIEADQDDNVETDNPSVRLLQDGRQIEGVMGMNGNADAEFDGAISNTLYLESAKTGGTGSIQFVTGRDPLDGLSKGSAKMTINSAGRVGVGTASPQEKLEVQDGSLRLTGDSQYVSFDVYRAPTSASSDDDLDGYEYFSAGVTSSTGVAHVSGSQGLNFHSNLDVSGAPQMYIAESGDVGIGTGTADPDAQMHLFRNSNSLYNLKVENGGGQAKGVLVTGGNTGSDASLLRVESYDATQRFLEVSDGRVNIGNDGGSTEFCLNGVCSSSLKTTQVDTTQINNSTFTKLAYVEGQRMGSTIEMSISGTSTNIVVNTDLKIIVGHTEGIYVESDSQEYTQLEIKIDADGSAGFTEQANFIVSARTLASSGPTTVKVEASPKNGELIKLNPTETVGGITHTHTTKKNSKSISSNKGGAGLYLNNNRVMDITSRNEMISAKDLAVGWYTVATNPGNRASARFGITDRTSGQHQATVFYAEHHFGLSNSINVISNGRYNRYGVDKIRIKEGGTYDGALLQVYVSQATSNLEFMMLGDNFQRNGWELVDWVPGGTNPGTVSNFSALVNVDSTVSLGGLANGGLATNGSIFMSGTKKFGGDYSTNRNNVDNAILLGSDGPETLQIFRQNSGTAPTYCGTSNYNDCYMFLMTDDNGNYPDGSILFGGVNTNNAFSDIMILKGNGNVGIGTLSPGAKLDVAGGVRATSFTTTSDRRLKRKITAIGNAMDTIDKIDGVTYVWSKEYSDDDRLQHGFIAQDLMKTLPDAVMQDDNGYYSVQYDQVIPILVEAVKEMDERHQDLEKRVDQHDDTLTYHEKKLKEHEAIIRLMKEASKEKSDAASDHNVTKATSLDSAEKDDKHDDVSVIMSHRESRGVMGRFYQ